jgi:hypothetical protein
MRFETMMVTPDDAETWVNFILTDSTDDSDV